MKQDLKKVFFSFLIFFIIGTFLCFCIYDRTKREFIYNNEIIVSSLLKNHPELEQEIILALTSPRNEEESNQVLSKYGLDSLDSLEYLDSLKNYRITFFGTFFLFYIVFSFFFFLFFFSFQKRRKQEILEVDKYLFSLLSDEIKCDLKSFQSGELESLQNDLMKVTSRLKNALESSNKNQVALSKTLADISHQLKTPLTSLLIINDALSSQNLEEEMRNVFLKRQESVILHMQNLIVTLLKVSQIESGMIELKKDKINTKELLKETFLDLDVLLVSKNINLELNIKEDIFIVGDFLWLREAILNIVKNAIEHSLQDGKIIISVLENPMYVEISIQDFGSGINPHDLPHIFERFYKSSCDKDSVGIGLNLSKSIIERMNATIHVKSKEHVTTIFTIHFYKGVV